MPGATFSFEEAAQGAPSLPQAAPPAMFSFEEAAQPVSSAPTAQPKSTGLIANIGAGTSEAVANTLGAPVDLATGGINLATRGINSLAGTNIPQIQNPVGGSEFIKSAEGLIGADPRNIAPANGVEQLGRAAGLGAGSMMLPWGIARALPVMGGMAGAAQQAFGSGSAAGMAGVGAVSGAAGQAAENAVPDGWKPLANFGAQLLAGGGVLGTVAGTKAVLDGGVNLARGFVAPLTEAGQQGLAGQRIAGAATDLPAVRTALENPAPPLVPGSQPTTFQATGDQGLGNLERATAKNAPEQFIDRANKQNAARVNAVQGLAPANASPEAVGQSFRNTLGDIDKWNTAAVEGAQKGAQDAADAIGGSPAAMTGDQQATALQGYGQQLRGQLTAGNDAARVAEGGLWRAIDPDGTLAVDMSPIKQQARSIMQSMPKNAAPLTGDEAGIFSTAQLLPQVQPFSELTALRGRLTDAMRQELMANGRSQTYGRLSSLLDSIHDTLQNSVEQRAAQDNAAVSAGVMSPENTMIANLHARQQEWYANRNAAVPGVEGEGSNTGDPGWNAGSGSDAVPGLGGAWSEAPRGQRAVGSNPRLAPQQAATLTPNFDQDAAARYQAARTATAERHATFTNAPGVGSAIAPGRTAAEFKMPESSVPSAVFSSGKGAAERVQAFTKAGGNPQTLADYAAFDLRRAAQAPDGTLDPGKYQRWANGHAEALSALETAAPGTLKKFSNAAAARQTLDDTMARTADLKKQFETSAAAKFLGDADPVASVGRILNSPNALAQMKQLASLTAHDAPARAGLQRAIVEYVLRNLQGNAAAGETGTNLLKSDAFQTFVKKTTQSLSQVFSPAQIESMRNVAADLQRTNKSIAGTKLPGGSNTAQDLAAGDKHGGGHPSVLGQVVAAEAIGEGVEHLAGPLGKVAGMIAVPIVNAMRQAGMRKVDDLVTAAMLHPDLAKSLLAKVPTNKADPVIVAIIRAKLKAVSLAASQADAHDRAPVPVEPQYGRLATPSNAPRVSQALAW